MKELKQQGFELHDTLPKVYCKAFEDNEGALEMARTPKMRPRTKHIKIKYHHFKEATADGRIEVKAIDTKQQQADIFTKPLDEATFIYLRRLIIGW